MPLVKADKPSESLESVVSLEFKVKSRGVTIGYTSYYI
jgi:hypothetical protein